jgi:hypothetical protein
MKILLKVALALVAVGLFAMPIVRTARSTRAG